MTMRLPTDKLEKINSLIRAFLGRRKCTKRELLSLIGLLAFACKVVKSGRIFLRRLIDLASSVTSLNHFIYLNLESRADIDWWARFLPSWNGVAIIHPTPLTSLGIRLFTDASDIGLGCVYGNHWLFAPWPDRWAPSDECHINVRELFAVWAAVFTWGDEWCDQELVIFTDNQSIIDIWTSGTSTDALIMAIVRALFFHLAERNANLILSYVPGSKNVDADRLSRLQVTEFKEDNPLADTHPTELRSAVWDLRGPN